MKLSEKERMALSDLIADSYGRFHNIASKYMDEPEIMDIVERMGEKGGDGNDLEDDHK